MSQIVIPIMMGALGVTMAAMAIVADGRHGLVRSERQSSVQPNLPTQSDGSSVPSLFETPLPSQPSSSIVNPPLIVKPSSVIQPSSIVKSSSIVKPSSVIQQSSIVKPSSVIQPSLIANPPLIVKPSSMIQPSSIVNPPLIGKPSSVIQPSSIVEPSSIPRPSPDSGDFTRTCLEQLRTSNVVLKDEQGIKRAFQLNYRRNFTPSDSNWILTDAFKDVSFTQLSFLSNGIPCIDEELIARWEASSRFSSIALFFLYADHYADHYAVIIVDHLHKRMTYIDSLPAAHSADELWTEFRALARDKDSLKRFTQTCDSYARVTADKTVRSNDGACVIWALFAQFAVFLNKDGCVSPLDGTIDMNKVYEGFEEPLLVRSWWTQMLTHLLPQSIKCLTFNVGFGGMSGDPSIAAKDVTSLDVARWCTAGPDNFKCLDKVVEVIRSVDADIVCLQEAMNYRLICDKLPEYTCHDTYACPAVSAKHGKFCEDIVTLFRKGMFLNPSSTQGNLCDTRNSNGDSIDARPFVISHVQRVGDKRSVVVVNIHNGHATYTKEHVQKRLSSGVRGIPITTQPIVIVAGDFNDRTQDFWKGFQPFGASDREDLRGVVVRCSEPPMSCCDSTGRFADNKATLIGDYVMTNVEFESGNKLVKGSVRSSDHLPVTATVTGVSL